MFYNISGISRLEISKDLGEIIALKQCEGHIYLLESRSFSKILNLLVIRQ